MISSEPAQSNAANIIRTVNVGIEPIHDSMTEILTAVTEDRVHDGFKELKEELRLIRDELEAVTAKLTERPSPYVA